MSVFATPSLGLGATLSVSAINTYALQKIGCPEISVDTVETSTLATAIWKTFIQALADGGDVTATVIFDYLDTSQAAIIALIGTGAVPLIVTFHNTKTMSFSALLSKFKVNDVTTGDLLTADITFKVTGAITFA
jgi:hypothetical protein